MRGSKREREKECESVGVLLAMGGRRGFATLGKRCADGCVCGSIREKCECV